MQIVDNKADPVSRTNPEITPDNVGSETIFYFLARLFTLLMNMIVLRVASPSSMGSGFLKLDLFMRATMFLVRESFRTALTQIAPPEKEDTAKVAQWIRGFVRVAWISVIVGVPLVFIMVAHCSRWPPVEIMQSEFIMEIYRLSIFLYFVGAYLELTNEPVMAQLQYHHKTKSRLAIDFISELTRSIVITLLNFKVGKPKNSADEIGFGLAFFTMGYVARMIVFELGMVYANIFVLNQSWLSATPCLCSMFDKKSYRNAGEMTKKFLSGYGLALADILIVSSFCQLSEQGVYYVVMSYGSLMCHLYFQPLQDLGLHLYSKAFRGGSKADRSTAISHLCLTLKYCTIISAIFIMIVPWYTYLIVRTFLGEGWASSSMPKVFRAYCLEIPSMAFCGILEPFMNVLQNPDWCRIRRVAIGIISVIHIGAACIAVQIWGTIGLIATSSLSFTLRAIIALVYLRNIPEWTEVSPGSIRPSLKFATALCLISVLSAAFFVPSFNYNASAALLSISILFTALFAYEKPFLLKMQNTLLSQDEKLKDS